MATLKTQYESYLKKNNLTDNHISYDHWLTSVLTTKFEPIIADDSQIDPEETYEHKEEEKLTLKPDGKNRYLVYFKQNMKCVGSFLMDVDGYYYYWPNNGNGCWSSHTLIMIADALDKINKPYDDHSSIKL